ncbi:MAG: DUF4912 domain-containing protein [Verrucomicrobiota bacterium]
MSDKKKAKKPAKPKISAEEMIPEGGLLGDGASSEASDPKLRTSAADFDTSAHKFDINSLKHQPQQAPVPAYEHLGELPSSYGTRKLYLTARDPHWLFCYWDLSFDQITEAERNAHDGKVFLQIYLSDGSRIQQIQITPWSKEWMIHANRPNTTFYAEIGYYRYDGNFEVISRSRLAQSPRDNLSENTDIRFATIPFKITFAELRELLSNLAKEGEALADTLARLQDEGYPLPFDHHGGQLLTEAERQLFLDHMEETFTKRIWIDSQEIVERFTKRFNLDNREGGHAWPPSSHWLAGSSMSSPFGGDRGFSMHVNAELIIYGGTDPGATMRIDGKQIPLDGNGNFHYHFNFADGKYHIPVEATSQDGIETRNALLSFLRMTATSGDVDATPQPQRDTPMGKID